MGIVPFNGRFLELVVVSNGEAGKAPVTSFASRAQGREGDIHNWLVVSTPLKNISQIGNLPQVGVKIKNIRNHHLDKLMFQRSDGLDTKGETNLSFAKLKRFFFQYQFQDRFLTCQLLNKKHICNSLKKRVMFLTSNNWFATWNQL